MLKKEVEALVSILDSGEYETPEDLAKAMYAASLSIFIGKDNWGVATGFKAIGPFANKAQAKSFAKRVGLNPEMCVRPMLSPSHYDLPEHVEKDPHPKCTGCGHLLEAHLPKQFKTLAKGSKLKTNDKGYRPAGCPMCDCTRHPNDPNPEP